MFQLTRTGGLVAQMRVMYKEQFPIYSRKWCILFMLMRVGAGVVVVVTTIAAGQHTICLRPTEPHIVGYRFRFSISSITSAHSSMAVQMPRAPLRATWHVSPTLAASVIHIRSNTSTNRRWMMFILCGAREHQWKFYERQSWRQVLI